MLQLENEDEEYLNANFSFWKILEAGVYRGIEIRSYPLPPGYNKKCVSLMILIPEVYPMGQFDMFYLFPEIERGDKNGIGGLMTERYFGIAWQRWSRHYTENLIKNGLVTLNSLASHIEYCTQILKTEAK